MGILEYKSGATILIVDDDKLNRIFLTKLLEKEGYHVVQAHDGYEGFKAAYDLKPDLMLLDVIMPKTDGFNVCKALKREPNTKDIPVIFVTSRADKSDIVSGFQAGAVDFVTKPVFMPELLARVRAHLSIKFYADQLRQKNEELEELNHLLKHLSKKDALMEIWNRGAFDIELEKLHNLSIRYERVYSLILADIDYFKPYNDYYGHQAGDEVLKEVGRIFRSACRATDFIARYGGEEIVVILPETNADQSVKLGNRIMEMLCEKNILHEKSPLSNRVTLTMGISELDLNNIVSYQEIVKMADIALYEGKNNGRNTIVIYNNKIVFKKQGAG